MHTQWVALWLQAAKQICTLPPAKCVYSQAVAPIAVVCGVAPCLLHRVYYGQDYTKQDQHGSCSHCINAQLGNEMHLAYQGRHVPLSPAHLLASTILSGLQ